MESLARALHFETGFIAQKLLRCALAPLLPAAREKGGWGDEGLPKLRALKRRPGARISETQASTRLCKT